MKRLFAVIIAFGLAASAAAQSRVDRPLFSKYDLDTPTEAADNNQIVESVNLVNGTHTIVASPDVCRNVTIAVTDTTPSITAGTVTVAGTDVNGAALSEAFDLAGPTLSHTGAQIFCTTASVTGADLATLGGGGDETIIVGTGSVVAYRYCTLSDPRPGSGPHIETSSSSTTVTAVTGTPFDAVAVGDEITASGPLGNFTRVIRAKASGASITVDSAVNLDVANGYGWTYRALTCGNSNSSGWIRLNGTRHNVSLAVRDSTATGGVDFSIEGRYREGLGLPVQLLTGNFSADIVTPGLLSATWGNTYEIEDAVTEIRVGLKFGTNDDSSDTGTESIDVTLTTEGAR
jgi:hypothetical protein